MKKNIYGIIALSLILSCLSCGGDGTEAPNTAPGVPVLEYPTPDLLCIGSDIPFAWKASVDDEGDPVTYVLEVSKTIDFSEDVINSTTTAIKKTLGLDIGTRYYWRMKAKDGKGAESEYSEGLQFYTEGEGEINHIPFSPQLKSPELESTISSASVVLEWDTSDLDANDTLTHDVYLGTTNPPTQKVATNHTSKSYTPTGLTAGTKYYWKITTRDDKGGAVIGNIWSFTTN